MMINIFVVFWVISLFLSIIRLGGLNQVSDYTYLLVYLGIIFFIIGFLSVKINRENELIFNQDFFSEKIVLITKNKFFVVLLIGVCIYVYSLVLKFLDVLVVSQNLADIRADYFSGNLYGSLFNYTDAFLLTPFSIFCTPIFAYMVFYKRNYVCLLLAFFLVGYESLGAGRFGYIRIFLAVVFVTYIMLDTYKTNKKKFIRFFSVLIIFLSLFLVVITTFRVSSIDEKQNFTESIDKTFNHITYYTAAPIVAFDYSLSNDYVGEIGGYKYGDLTFSVVTSFINLFTSKFGFSFDLSLPDLVKIKQDRLIKIGENSDGHNALYTANLYFYCDFGLFGVIIFPFFFGRVLRLLIRKMYNTKSYLMLAVVSWCYYVAFFSVVDFFMVNPYVFLCLIIFILLGMYKKF